MLHMCAEPAANRGTKCRHAGNNKGVAHLVLKVQRVGGLLVDGRQVADKGHLAGGWWGGEMWVSACRGDLC